MTPEQQWERKNAGHWPEQRKNTENYRVRYMTHKHGCPNIHSFKIFKFVLKIRDLIIPPRKLLGGIDEIKAGTIVLDYGCGPGSYAIAAARIVGPSGKVYAADSNPLAINAVEKTVTKKGIVNIKTLLTDSHIGLINSSVDVILLIYVLHEFVNPGLIVNELYRVLKPDGILVVKENKLANNKVIFMITHDSRFKLQNRGKQGEIEKSKAILFFTKE